MEQGFTVDRGDYDADKPGQWASGTPSTSFWSWGYVQKGERKLAVVTFRCPRCAYLESYAPEG